jgi:hypothetical protein
LSVSYTTGLKGVAIIGAICLLFQLLKLHVCTSVVITCFVVNRSCEDVWHLEVEIGMLKQALPDKIVVWPLGDVGKQPQLHLQ